MESMSEVLICPQGHASTDRDYCSACGARIQGSTPQAYVAGGGAPETAGSGETCPDCGMVREQNEIAFCEVCGYNFLTGAHGEIGIMPVQPKAEPGPDPVPVQQEPEREPALLIWALEIGVDPALRQDGSPECPADVQPRRVELNKAQILIGRVDASRAIEPEVSMDLDQAVSRRHALVQRNEQGEWLLRDIGSANGTRLNGVELEPMADHTLHDGDVITIGHWSRILVTARP